MEGSQTHSDQDECLTYHLQKTGDDRPLRARCKTDLHQQFPFKDDYQITVWKRRLIVPPSGKHPTRPKHKRKHQCSKATSKSLRLAPYDPQQPRTPHETGPNILRYSLVIDRLSRAWVKTYQLGNTHLHTSTQEGRCLNFKKITDSGMSLIRRNLSRLSDSPQGWIDDTVRLERPADLQNDGKPSWSCAHSTHEELTQCDFFSSCTHHGDVKMQRHGWAVESVPLQFGTQVDRDPLQEATIYNTSAAGSLITVHVGSFLNRQRCSASLLILRTLAVCDGKEWLACKLLFGRGQPHLCNSDMYMVAGLSAFWQTRHLDNTRLASRDALRTAA